MHPDQYEETFAEEVVQARNPQSLVLKDEYESNEVLKQVQKIQELMQKVMVKDEHYGIIPGTKKPSLLKPGAEKLGLTFRLSPKFEISKSELPNYHREYEVICTLYHIPTGKVMGQGVGSCSTMEAKYRFRTGEVTETGKPVPKEYWNNRDINLIGGKGHGTRKIDGKWEIVEIGEKVEHDNPADYYNTVLKMAKKRAHVDAMLTATAASDIFTQDVEDMKENEDSGKKKVEPENKSNGENSNTQNPTIGKNGDTITKAQQDKLHATCREMEITDKQRHAVLRTFKYDHTKDILKSDYDKILEFIQTLRKTEETEQEDLPF